VLNGGVFLLDRAGKISTAVPKRRGIGGMALHASDALVVGGRDIACVSLKDGATRSLLALDAIPGATGFNDLTTDAGRPHLCRLARLQGVRRRDAEARASARHRSRRLDAHAVDGVLLTNGLGFSPDGKKLYHCDARGPYVRVYDVNADGSVGPWRKFASLGDDKVPDGLKVAEDGSVWVADAHGGRVAVFNADGTHRQDIAVPLPMVTSLCFAGDDLRDLYIVTGSRGGPHDNCGSIFHTRPTCRACRCRPPRSRCRKSEPAQPAMRSAIRQESARDML
jgi:gluconolactonase